jgi:molybdopterin converting factor small subunit
MAITVKTVRPLAAWIGNKRIEIEWPGGTLEELIRYLHEKTGANIEGEVLEADGSLAYVVTVNGEIQRTLSASIQDGDEISFLLPIGGG